MRNLVVIRHGNTFAPGETPRRVGAGTDLPLVASGEAQARAAGVALAAAGLRPDRVLTGPLKRARQTAALLLEAFEASPAPELASFLDEIDHGPDENRPEAEVTARLGEAAIAAWDRSGIAPEGWTVRREERIAAWREAVAEASRAGPGTTLLVTSNGAARFVLLAFPQLAAGPDASAAGDGGLKLRTGAWGRIRVAPDGTPTLVEWNVRPAG